MQTTGYSTVVEAINDLQKQGYTHEFILDEEKECVVCHQHAMSLAPEDFKIDDVFRFDGQSDPDDETIVYAISSPTYGVKGILVNAFGVYSDERANRLIEKLRIHTEPAPKPIKRHEALAAFSRDHHAGLLLCWKVRQGLRNRIPLSRISDYVLFFFDRDLSIHFAEEENNLFTNLTINDPLKLRALTEHQLIRDVISALRNGDATPESINTLADTLEKHIRFEERVLFNYLQKNLTHLELEKLMQHPDKIVDIDKEWNDPFWQTKR